jgi:uncharacterized protein (TIGR02145 family)
MRTKSLIFVLVIAVVFICLAMTDSNAEYVCGDANSDGLLNVSDAVYIINYVFIVGSPAPDPNCCGFACGGTITDYDGNFYRTVQIGDQCWMMDNLKVTHYRNGDLIPNVTDAAEWHALSTGAYCEYNSPYAVITYGRLYNWYAVDDSRNIAPEGWHVPTDAELKQLEMYLGMSQAWADATGWRGTDEGGKLKEAGILYWYVPNTGATNESGFTALPGGYRSDDGYFYLMGTGADLWSATGSSGTDAWRRYLSYSYSQVVRDYYDKHYGFSVRCVRD